MESLEFLSKEQQDNANIVREHIEALGEQEFKFASANLRSDAEYILSLVEKFPKVLKYVGKIYERNCLTGKLEKENEVTSNVFFAAECFWRNKETFKYINDDLAVQYYEMVKEGFMREGWLLNYRIRWIGNADNCEQDLKELEKLRPGIVSLAEISNDLEV